MRGKGAPPEWAPYFLMAEEGWGQTPKELEDTLDEVTYARWLALNAARGEASKKSSGATTTQAGVTITEF